MPVFTDIYAPIIGRILMGGFFLWEGIERTLNFASTAELMTSAGLPFPVTLTVLVVAIEVLGGIALIVGYKTTTTSLVLAIFMVITSLLYVNFNDELGLSLFIQSMAILGGLLYMSAYSSGFRPRK